MSKNPKTPRTALSGSGLGGASRFQGDAILAVGGDSGAIQRAKANPAAAALRFAKKLRRIEEERQGIQREKEAAEAGSLWGFSFFQAETEMTRLANEVAQIHAIARGAEIDLDSLDDYLDQETSPVPTDNKQRRHRFRIRFRISATESEIRTAIRTHAAQFSDWEVRVPAMSFDGRDCIAEVETWGDTVESARWRAHEFLNGVVIGLSEEI